MTGNDGRDLLDPVPQRKVCRALRRIGSASMRLEGRRDGRVVGVDRDLRRVVVLRGHGGIRHRCHGLIPDGIDVVPPAEQPRPLRGYGLNSDECPPLNCRTVVDSRQSAARLPSVAIDSPAVAIDSPSVDTLRPAVDTLRPSVAIDSPAVDTTRPSVAIDSPSVDTSRPAVAAVRPLVAVDSPSVDTL